MEWLDEAIVLSARPHGETASIVVLLTAEHGCHAGLVPGGQGRKAQGLLQSGNEVKARWRARLLDHLGVFSLELTEAHPAAWLDEACVLNLIASACAITEASLPERQAMGGVYAGLKALFSISDPDLWGPAYVKWELGLLRALGYGLDFSRCALTGETEGLSFVSPRTGRAVTREAAAPYRDKLLTLPAFLTGGGWDDNSIVQGLELTGHFLERHVFAHPPARHLIPEAGMLPLARQRAVEFFRNRANPT
jgi:DNA repair protein RecO (recombination protein O)